RAYGAGAAIKPRGLPLDHLGRPQPPRPRVVRPNSSPFILGRAGHVSTTAEAPSAAEHLDTTSLPAMPHGAGLAASPRRCRVPRSSLWIDARDRGTPCVGCTV